MNCQLSLVTRIPASFPEETSNRFKGKVLPLVDEMIIVQDTGSPADDLNESLAKANGFWILRLDPHEELAEEQTYRLQMLANRTDREGYHFPIYPDQVERYHIPFELKLFRNRPHYRYRGKTCPRLPVELETTAELADLQIIQHCGRQPKDTDLILDELKMDAASPNAPSLDRLHLSVELARKRLVHESVPIWKELLLKGRLPARYEGFLCKWIAQWLEEKEGPVEASDYVGTGINRHPDNMDLRFLQGQLLMRQGKYEEARAQFEYCLSGGSGLGEYVHEVGVTSFKAQYYLGQVSEMVADIPLALAHYEKAFGMNENFTEPCYRIAHLVHRLGGADQVGESVRKLLDLRKSPHLELLADILFAEQLYPEAKDAAKKAYELRPDKVETVFLLANCLLMNGEIEDSLYYFQKIAGQHHLYLPSKMRMCQGRWLMEDWDSAATELDELNRLNVSIGRIYRSVHGALTGQIDEISVMAAIDQSDAADHVTGILNRMLVLNKDGLITRLVEWIAQNPFLYSYAGKMFYLHKRYDLADPFLTLCLPGEEDLERIIGMLSDAKRKQNLAHEAAQLLHSYLGKKVFSMDGRVQYADILVAWARELVLLGKRRHTHNERLSQLNRKIKELSL